METYTEIITSAQRVETLKKMIDNLRKKATEEQVKIDYYTWSAEQETDTKEAALWRVEGDKVGVERKTTLDALQRLEKYLTTLK